MFNNLMTGTNKVLGKTGELTVSRVLPDEFGYPFLRLRGSFSGLTKLIIPLYLGDGNLSWHNTLTMSIYIRDSKDNQIWYKSLVLGADSDDDNCDYNHNNYPLQSSLEINLKSLDDYNQGYTYTFTIDISTSEDYDSPNDTQAFKNLSDYILSNLLSEKDQVLIRLPYIQGSYGGSTTKFGYIQGYENGLEIKISDLTTDDSLFKTYNPGRVDETGIPEYWSPWYDWSPIGSTISGGEYDVSAFLNNTFAKVDIPDYYISYTAYGEKVIDGPYLFNDSDNISSVPSNTSFGVNSEGKPLLGINEGYVRISWYNGSIIICKLYVQ